MTFVLAEDGFQHSLGVDCAAELEYRSVTFCEFARFMPAAVPVSQAAASNSPHDLAKLA